MAWSNAVNATQTGVQTINAGVWTGSALTQFDTLVGGANSSIVSIATGTNGQVLTSNGAGTNPSYQTITAALLPWTVITAATQTIAVNNGYFSNAASGGVTYTLPATAAVGTQIRISGLSGGSGWVIQQNALQSIELGNTITTVGTGGSLASTGNTDSVFLVCAVADTTWVGQSEIGNITVV